jgi:replicative DNA helicase
MTEQNGSLTDYKPDIKQIADFIRALHGSDPKGYLCIAQFHTTNKEAPAKQEFKPASDLQTAIKKALEMQAATTVYDNYIGVCTYKSVRYRDKDGKEKSGRHNNNPLSIPGVFLDLDTNTGRHSKTNNPDTPTEALRVLQSITGHEPSIAIDTIGGVHVYFLFSEPFIARSNEEVIFMQEQVMKPFYKAFKALYMHDLYGGYDEPDNVLHPSRVLRLPGMITRKYGGVTKYMHKDGERFTIDQIQAITNDMQANYKKLTQTATEPQKPAPNSAGNTNQATTPGERDRSEIDRLKAYLPNYLKDKMNIDYQSRFKCINPACTSSQPEREQMSYHATEQYIRCYSCTKSYDLYSLIGLNENISTFAEQKKRAEAYYNDFDSVKPYEKAPTKPSDLKPSATIAEAHKNVHMTDYFERRGLRSTIIEKYKLGYQPDQETVILPIGDSYYMKRNTEYKHHEAMKGYEKPIFNAHYLQTASADDVIFITESIIDALSLEEVKPDIKAIALNGTGENLLLNTIKQYGTQAAFAIAVDSDSSGNEAAERIRQKLTPHGLLLYRFNVAAGESYKDINEYLLGDEIGLLSDIISTLKNVKAERERERSAYLRSSAGHYSREGFIDSLNASLHRNAIPTGFKALDHELDGGFYPGLYFIGAISSLGKTTYVLQVADQVAKAGYDVLIFSLEMSKDELIAKSISRLTCEMELNAGRATQYSKMTRGILNAKNHAKFSEPEQAAFQAALHEYYKIANERIYIHESMGELGVKQVKEEVYKHIKYTGNTPIVIIDYLQILAPHDMRATDKQNTDKDVSELKRLSRDVKTSIIGISSFNRESYKQSVSMASFKESGAIEYSADVLIGLQLDGVDQTGFDVDAAKEKEPREIELKILKNRNGHTGANIAYKYYAKFNYFLEQGKKEKPQKITSTDEQKTQRAKKPRSPQLSIDDVAEVVAHTILQMKKDIL